MQLQVHEPHARLVGHLLGLDNRVKALGRLPAFQLCGREQREKVWTVELVPRRAICADITAKPRRERVATAFLRLDPALEDPSEREPLLKSVLGRESD